MHPAEEHSEGRASRPGLRRARRSAMAMAVIALLAACGPSKPARYGGLPKFLPTTAVSVDRIVSASATKPQLAVQGVPVAVSLKGGHVLATVVGPAVPPFVSPPPPGVTATFTVTLAQAEGSVPVAIEDFSISDQLGRLDHPLLVTGEAAPPDRVAPGGQLSFRLTAVLPTGEGVIHWSPGGITVASWDFVVEND